MAANDPHELKNLTQRKKRLDVQLSECTDRVNARQEEFNIEKKSQGKLVKELNVVDNSIRSLEERNKRNQTPIVTEHALLRYVENVLGIDLQEIQANILSDANLGMYRQLGDGRYPVGDCKSGFKAVFKNGSVVTVVDANNTAKKAKKAKKKA